MSDLQDSLPVEERPSSGAADSHAKSIPSVPESTFARQLAMATKELEQTRARLREREQEAEQMERDALSTRCTLEEQCDALRVQLLRADGRHENVVKEKKELEGRIVELEKELLSLGEVTDLLGVELASAFPSPGPSDPSSESGAPAASQKDGAAGTKDLAMAVALAKSRGESVDTKLLLKLMHEELASHKRLLTEYRLRTETMQREDEKGTMMMGLLSSQLEATREQNHRLLERVSELQKTAKEAEQKITTLKDRCDALELESDKAISSTAARERLTSMEIGLHKRQVEELSRKLETTEGALRDTQARLRSAEEQADSSERKYYEERVELKGRIEQLRGDLESAHKSLEASAAEHHDRDTLQTTEIQSLMARLRRIQLNAETKEAELRQTNLELLVDADRINAELARSKLYAAEAEKELTAKLTTSDAALSEKTRAFETHSAQAAAKEKEYFEKLALMTARHDTVEMQLSRLQRSSAAKEKEYVDNTVFASAAKETLQIKLNDATEELKRVRGEYAASLQAHTKEIKTLVDRLEDSEGSYKTGIRALSSKLEETLDAKRAAEGWIVEAAAAEKQAAGENWARFSRLKAEKQELATELATAKRAIERLESEIGSTFRYKRLEESNQALQQEIASLKARNNKLEGDAADRDAADSSAHPGAAAASAREQMLVEQNEMYVRRLQEQQNTLEVTMSVLRQMNLVLGDNGLDSVLRSRLSELELLAASPTSAIQSRRTSRIPQPPSVKQQQQQQQQRHPVNGSFAVASRGSPRFSLGAIKHSNEDLTESMIVQADEGERPSMVWASQSQLPGVDGGMSDDNNTNNNNNNNNNVEEEEEREEDFQNSETSSEENELRDVSSTLPAKVRPIANGSGAAAAAALTAADKHGGAASADGDAASAETESKQLRADTHAPHLSPAVLRLLGL